LPLGRSDDRVKAKGGGFRRRPKIQPIVFEVRGRDALAEEPALTAARGCAVGGVPTASRRAGSVIHDSGRYNSQVNGHVRPSAISALKTATWQLPILPSAHNTGVVRRPSG
jgi:hypothetical protein